MSAWVLLFSFIGMVGVGLWIRDIMRKRHAGIDTPEETSDETDWHITHYPVDEILQKERGPKRWVSSSPVTVPGGMRFTYKGDKEALKALAIDQRFEELGRHIRVTDAGEDLGDGLDFLDETPYGLLNKKAFVRFLREVTGTSTEHPMILYRRFYGTETRYYDHWSKDYVYHYSYVVLMPDDTYTELKADRSYSPTMERD